MKYIDAYKLIKKFEKMIDDIPASVDSGAGYVIDEVYKIIDSLQREQPIKVYRVESQKELNEVAKEIAYSVCRQLPNGKEKDNIVYYAILAAKAGAEWVAEQIVNKINSI